MTTLKFLSICIVILIFGICVFPFLILVFVGIYAVIYNHFKEERLRIRMKRSERFLNKSQIKKNITEDKGTLIIEYPAPGWGFTRAWWTPDDVFEKSSLSFPNIEERNILEDLGDVEWDGWCWKTYLSPDNGSAYLLRVHNGKSLEKKLKKKFLDLKVAHVYSGLFFLSGLPNKESK